MSALPFEDSGGNSGGITSVRDIVHALRTGNTRPRILCVGDVILDRYIMGHIERVSREAPVPIVLTDRITETLGGGGNVHENLADLGVDSHLLAIVGDDVEGRRIRELAEAKGGGTIIFDSARATVTKSRIVCEHQQVLRLDREARVALSAAMLARVLEGFRAQIQHSDAVILSDYALGLMTRELVAAVIDSVAQERKRRNCALPILVDPKGPDFARYRGVDYVTPNRQELGIATGMPTDTDAQIIAAARTLIADCGILSILSTRSEEGMTLVSSCDVHHLPTEAIEIFDVAGAGDTVIASFATALAIGVAPEIAAGFSNTAAGIVVGKEGTATATPAEIHERLNTRRRRSAQEKWLPLAAALPRIAEWRRDGLRIGVTNGCFDLLHPGHLKLLQDAGKQCDRLIVALNADSSVRALKGDTRPIQDEFTRAIMLSSLLEVDLVVVFAESTATALLQAIQPDVYLKGGDYQRTPTEESEFVRSYGGSVEFIALADGYSTTATITRIKSLQE